MRRPGTPQDTGTSPFRHNLETFVRPNLLLVEGPDEFEFFRFLRPREDVQIHSYGGKNQLRLHLATMRGVEGFDQIERVAIVRDADNDPRAATQSVLTQWSLAMGEAIPNVVSDQWFEDEERRQWSVWIMPAPDSTGDLEELLWRAVGAGDHRSCIDKLMDCLDECNPVPFRSSTKARLYAWLSTQKDPLKELHAAFHKSRNLFSNADAVFTRFVTMMDAL